MSNVRDFIEMEFRSNTTREQMLSVSEDIISVLSNSILPAPVMLDVTDKTKVSISGFSDPRILIAIQNESEARQLPIVLWGTSNHSAITLGTSPKYYLGIKLPFENLKDPDFGSVRDLFKSICQLMSPTVAACHGRSSFISIGEKYFEWESRTTHFTFFSWLNYFGAEEFKLQGGEAIFQNPYIKANSLGEGVLIQVGPSPLDARTPEGEELIVKATRALPPVVKD